MRKHSKYWYKYYGYDADALKQFIALTPIQRLEWLWNVNQFLVQVRKTRKRKLRKNEKSIFNSFTFNS